MSVTDAELIDVTVEAMTMFLGAAPRPCDRGPAPAEATVSATVQLGDPPRAAVTLAATTPLVVELAACVLGVDEPHDDDTHDALGEVANIVAGAVKPHLGVIAMSLPTVTSGTHLQLRVPGAELTRQAALCHDEERLLVQLHERREQTEPTARLRAASADGSRRHRSPASPPREGSTP